MKQFNLENRHVVITGGAGLLGRQHALAIVEAGGIPVIYDIDKINLLKFKNFFEEKKFKGLFFEGSVVSEKNLIKFSKFLIDKKVKVNVLINNAALNPKLAQIQSFNKLENFSLERWNKEIKIGLTGAFLTSKIIGSKMAKNIDGGIIINISSDLGLISPDQRIYNEGKIIKNVKPITYSVVKHGIIGLTKYLATYSIHKKIRCNCLCPGGVYDNHDKKFVKKLSNLIPLNRMAKIDEYKGAIQFLSSDASSYMNGANLVLDGGRSSW